MKKLLFLIGILFSVTICFAQDPKGTISGKITDENGRPVREADVFVYNGDEIVGSAITEQDGSYLTNRMYAGDYKIQVIYGAYKQSWVNNVPIKAWQNTRVNVKLEVKDADPATPSSRDYSGGSTLQSTKK
jgi:hypothetical protein